MICGSIDLRTERSEMTVDQKGQHRLLVIIEIDYFGASCMTSGFFVCIGGLGCSRSLEKAWTQPFINFKNDSSWDGD